MPRAWPTGPTSSSLIAAPAGQWPPKTARSARPTKTQAASRPEAASRGHRLRRASARITALSGIPAVARVQPELAHLAFSLRGRAARRILVRGCGWLAGRGRCRAVARRVVWAVLVIVGGRGWEYGRGLPVTPSARGMRARNLAWRGDSDLRVASCCR